MIRVIIVDDEIQCCETLAESLNAYCPQIELLAQCRDVEEAKIAIARFEPDLVFLDIEMPHASGFDLLVQINPTNFEVIFTTAHDQYAIRAIKFSALDFLLKPIGRQDLEQAVHRAAIKETLRQKKIDTLLYNLNYLNSEKKIALPTLNGLEFVSVGDIVRCESDNNYTVFYMLNQTKIVVSKTLKEYDDMLDEYHFFRVHQSHLINLRYIKNYIKGEGGVVTMTDNSTVDVSRRKKDEFLKRLSIL